MHGIWPSSEVKKMAPQIDARNTYLEPGSEEIFCIAFICVIFVLFLYLVYYLLIFPSKKRDIRSFFYAICSLLLHVPAFYFLMKCVTHNWGLGSSHETRSTDFGLAGVFWLLAVILGALMLKHIIKNYKK